MDVIEIINIEDFYSYKGAKYSDNAMYQIYLVQYAMLYDTTVGSDPATDVYYREQQVKAVCEWIPEETELTDPRDQESNDTLSEAISDLMDHAAISVPLANGDATSSFSASLRTTFV